MPDAAALNGTVTDDGLPTGSTLTILWSKFSGPGTVAFANPNAASTTAIFSQAGTYVLRLSASDTQLSSSDDVTVTVKTGKVSVYTEQATNKTDSRQEIILTPNQQIVYHRNENQTVKMLVNDPQVITPQSSQKTSYTNVAVPEIFRALEERYGIPIQFDANVLSGCTITYADLTEEGLYEQIEIICNALGARYKKSESSIVIEAEGCK